MPCLACAVTCFHTGISLGAIVAETESDKIDKLFGMVIDLTASVLRVMGAVELIRIIALPENEETNQEVRKAVVERLADADKGIDDLIVKIRNFREPR